MGQGDDFLEASKKSGDIAVPRSMVTGEEVDTFEEMPALEGEETGGEVAENVQPSSNDARQVATATGVETSGNGSTSTGQVTPPAADLLQARRDEAMRIFIVRTAFKLAEAQAAANRAQMAAEEEPSRP